MAVVAKRFFPLIFLLIFGACKNEKTLHEGDLLFKDTQNTPFSTAIKAVTVSGNYSFSHVAVLFREGAEWKVLEAVPKGGVQIVSLEDFCTPKDGEYFKIFVGRLKKEYPFDLQKLIAYGKSQVGKKYDSAFAWDDSTFYCSELVYKMFSNAGQKQAFTPKPMTFKEKGKDSFYPTWISYYEKLQQPIPEGKLGINPSAMANEKSLTILFELE